MKKGVRGARASVPVGPARPARSALPNTRSGQSPALRGSDRAGTHSDVSSVPRNSAAARALLAWLAAALLLAGFARLAVDTPWLVFVAALLPAAVAGALVVRLDRRTHTPRRVLLAAFLWGAVVAPAVAVTLNEAIRAWLGDVAGPAQAARWTGALAAPAVEEIAKAGALAILVLLRRRDVRGVGDGIVFGALVGIGFTMAENLYYFALAAVARGSGGLAESIWLRAALGGLLHPTFTATAGAGLGWARRAGRGAWRGAAPWLGLGLAILQHVAWNAAGAPWLDAATCGPGAAACALDGRLRYWLLTAPAIVLVFVGPGLAALGLLARRDRERVGT